MLNPKDILPENHFIFEDFKNASAECFHPLLEHTEVHVYKNLNLLKTEEWACASSLHLFKAREIQGRVIVFRVPCNHFNKFTTNQLLTDFRNKIIRISTYRAHDDKQFADLLLLINLGFTLISVDNILEISLDETSNEYSKFIRITIMEALLNDRFLMVGTDNWNGHIKLNSIFHINDYLDEIVGDLEMTLHRKILLASIGYINFTDQDFLKDYGNDIENYPKYLLYTSRFDGYMGDTCSIFKLMLDIGTLEDRRRVVNILSNAPTIRRKSFPMNIIYESENDSAFIEFKPDSSMNYSIPEHNEIMFSSISNAAHSNFIIRIGKIGNLPRPLLYKILSYGYRAFVFSRSPYFREIIPQKIANILQGVELPIFKLKALYWRYIPPTALHLFKFGSIIYRKPSQSYNGISTRDIFLNLRNKVIYIVSSAVEDYANELRDLRMRGYSFRFPNDTFSLKPITRNDIYSDIITWAFIDNSYLCIDVNEHHSTWNTFRAGVINKLKKCSCKKTFNRDLILAKFWSNEIHVTDLIEYADFDLIKFTRVLPNVDMMYYIQYHPLEQKRALIKKVYNILKSFDRYHISRRHNRDFLRDVVMDEDIFIDLREETPYLAIIPPDKRFAEYILRIGKIGNLPRILIYMILKFYHPLFWYL